MNPIFILTPPSRLGKDLVNVSVVCPRNGTAALESPIPKPLLASGLPGTLLFSGFDPNRKKSRCFNRLRIKG